MSTGVLLWLLKVYLSELKRKCCKRSVMWRILRAAALTAIFLSWSGKASKPLKQPTAKSKETSLLTPTSNPPAKTDNKLQ